MTGHRDGVVSPVDLAAVERDDVVLDLVARRVGPSAGAPEDPAVRLLRALTADVDAGLAQLLAHTPAEPAGAPAAGHAGAPLADGPRRHHLARGTVVALVLGATLSVSGVSAAVTGDPLAAYRSVADALTPQRGDLPATAADIARWNRQVTTARALVRAGDPAATGALEALRAALATSTDLPPGQRAVLLRKLDRLRAELDAGAAPRGRSGKATDHQGPGVGPHGQGGTRDADENADGNADGKTDGTAEEKADGKGDRSPAGTGGPGDTGTDRGGSAGKHKDPASPVRPSAEPKVREDREQGPAEGTGKGTGRR